MKKDIYVFRMDSNAVPYVSINEKELFVHSLRHKYIKPFDKFKGVHEIIVEGYFEKSLILRCFHIDFLTDKVTEWKKEV